MPIRNSSSAAHETVTDVAVGSLTFDTFAELATWDRGPCVTIMTPIDAGVHQILLKDLARMALNALAGEGTPHGVATELLAPAEALRHESFENQAIRGIAVLTAPGQTRTLEMGTTPPALVHVGERFVVTPLLADVIPTIAYHLLALSEHRVRLFRGNVGRLEPVRAAGMPRRLEDVSAHERLRRGHGGGLRHGTGHTAGVVHGGGSDRDLHLDRMRHFLRAVDDAVRGEVRSTHAPLLVAGVGRELSIYRDVSRVERLVTIEVGNPDRMSAAALYERCAPTIADVLDRPRRARLRDTLESGATIRSLPELVDACTDGRVDTLFVRPDRLAWAAPRSGGRTATAQRHAGDVEWHSEAIDAALLHGASVFAAQPGELPEDTSAVASVRY